MIEKEKSSICRVYRSDLDKIAVLRRRRGKRSQEQYIRYLIEKDEKDLKKEERR